MSHTSRLVTTGALLLALTACSSQSADPEIDAAAQRARQLAAAPKATTTAPAAAVAASPMPSDSASAEPTASPGTDAVASTASARPTKPHTGKKTARKWSNYPWPSSAWPACDPPSSSPGINRSPGKPGVVVIVGDSLIRDDRGQLTSALADVGYTPVFICKGGMGLQWGQEQLDTLRSLKLVPRCLVFNLGTNDLKGTTEQGLTDAVPLPQVSERLRSLLLSAADIEHLLVVDIAADTARAPSTLASIREAPDMYRAIAQDVGVGTVVPWAKKANRSASNFGSDGVHDSARGASKRAQTVAQSVQSECG